MKTATEFMAEAETALAKYPAIAALYRVKDPRVMAPLAANAAMLALFSQEQDVAAMEPFSKARDMTVLADGAAKGVLPFGTGQRSTLAITNPSAVAFDVAAGRRLLDPQGRVHVVTVGATVPAQGAAQLSVVQEVTTVVTHLVGDGVPFYRLPIDQPAAGYLAGVSVTDSQGRAFSYQPSFANTGLDERVYHMESDENRTLSLRFGATDIGGYQVATGETLLVQVRQTAGAITLSAGAPFVFEYATTNFESGAKITLAAVVATGSAPMDIETMREVTSFPSLYDESAVYLGEFDYTLRRNLPTFRFLSVWNERIEEEVRGPNVANINRLFVAALKDDVQTDALRADIKRVVARADNSYRVTFVDVAEVPVPLTVKLLVPSVYDAATVRAAAMDLILGQYGRDSAWAKRGRGRILYRTVTSLLEDGVAACRADGADIQVMVSDSATILPETYRYVSKQSLTLTVETYSA